jgi:isoquinoline 1-oxidoreductase alpha subunit
MPKQTFILNGKPVTVNVNDDVRVLWVLRDLLGVTGPKYGCGINVCKACTSHINGKAFNPCSVKVGDLKKKDRVTTIEGLPDTVGKKLHPMQQAWIDRDVPQCGYCQPGQIMAAVATVKKVRRHLRPDPRGRRGGRAQHALSLFPSVSGQASGTGRYLTRRSWSSWEIPMASSATAISIS